MVESRFDRMSYELNMSCCRTGGVQSRIKQQRSSVNLNSGTNNAVALLIVMNCIVVKFILYTGA